MHNHKYDHEVVIDGERRMLCGQCVRGIGRESDADQARPKLVSVDGSKPEGVSRIIRNGFPKPALVKWAADTAAELAVAKWDELAQLPLTVRLATIAGAADAARDTASERGSRVHALVCKLVQNEDVTAPADIAGYIKSFNSFLADWKPVTLMTEVYVYHEKYLYTGRFDLIATIGWDRWLLDFKTSHSEPRGDIAFQLAAYRYATHYIEDDINYPMVPVDRCGVVWLRPDGYELYPYQVDGNVFRQFLSIQKTAHAARDCQAYRLAALTGLPEVSMT